MRLRFVNVLAGVALVAGCASVGQDFEMTEVDRFQPGLTTLEQAKEKLGKPQSVTTAADGRIGVVWVRSQATMGSASSKGVAILFDKDGKMIRVVNRNEIKSN
ncbi:hypothetical protein MASR1M59_26640 [Melaminivora sp.]